MQNWEPIGVLIGIGTENWSSNEVVFGTNDTRYFATALPSTKMQSVMTNVVRPETSLMSTG